MPPPQCPECGRFLATAFVQQIKSQPAPCPRCGTELSLADDTPGAVTPDETPPVPPPAAALPSEAEDLGDVGDEDVGDEDVGDEGVGDEHAGDEDAVTPAASPPDDVEPEPETSVRPPDLASERDPLAGWDRDTAVVPAAGDRPDPAELAVAAVAGALLGALLGGSQRRSLGALVGAALGALLARLRG